MCYLLHKDANLFDSEFRGAEDGAFFQIRSLARQAAKAIFLMQVNRGFLVY